MLDQTLGLFDHHFGDLDVASGGLVEGGGDNLTLHAALHVGDFLGPLVDQQHDQEDFGMIVGDRLGDILQHHRLADARRRDDQRALALALRGNDVDDAGRLVLDGRVQRIEPQLLVRIERRQIVEIDAVANHIGIIEIDRGQLGEGKIALAILGRADLTFHRVASAQAEFADLIRRNIDVIGTSQEIGFRAAQEAETIGQHLDRAFTHDLFAIFRLGLQDREHQVLFAQRRCAFYAQFLRHGDEVGGDGFLEVLEVHERVGPMR